ncbi:MAG: DUF1353 domain-containing protein [Candidatus Thiodiazotropha sp.]
MSSHRLKKWLDFLILPTVFMVIFISQITLAEETLGRFDGKVVAEWLEGNGPDREMKLKEDFTFVDQNGKQWIVTKGAKVDGASIPWVFWRIVGPPFVGDYRRASVVHDFYCDNKSESWQDVHKMFYDASIAGGVPETKAKIMYAAVYAGGPRWETAESLMEKGIFGAAEDFVREPIISNEKLDNAVDWIEKNNPSIEVLRARLDTLIEDPAEELLK